jgi:hypothetical protein
MLVGIASLAVMGQALPAKALKVVEAEKIVLRDDKGKLRGELTASRAGIDLSFYGDDSRVPAVYLSVTERSAELFLRDLQKHSFVNLSTGSEGSPSVYLMRDMNVAQLSVSPTGIATLALNKSLHERVRLTLEDKPALIFLDETGSKPVAFFGVSDEGMPAVLLFDKMGNHPRAGSWVAPDNSVSFALYGDSEQNPRARLDVASDGSPKLRFLDKDGKDIVSLPAGGGDVTGHPWVLWVQWLSFGGKTEQVAIAVGAWPTRQECEAQQSARMRTAPDTSRAPVVFACLPDTVDPRPRP